MAGSTIVGLTGFLFFFVLLWGYLDAKREPIVWIVLFAYALRVVAYGLHRSLMPGLYTERLHPFEPTGWAWASEGMGQVAASFTFGSDFFSWVISVVYLFLPRSTMLISSFNIFMGAMTVYVVYKITYIYVDYSSAKMSAILTSLFPVLILQNVILSRESFIIFFVSLGCFNIIRYSRETKYIYIVYGLVCIFLSSSPHTGILVSYILAFILLITLIFSNNIYRVFVSGVKMTFSKKGIFTVALVGFLVLVLAMQFQDFREPLMKSKFSLILSAQSPVEPLVNRYKMYAGGVAGFPQWLTPALLPLAILIMPIRAAFFMYSPFPWMISSIRHIFGFINGIALIFLSFYTYKFFIYKDSYKSYSLIYVGLFILCFILIFSVAVSNFGQAFRHRAKILPLLISFGIAGWSTRSSARR